MAARDRTKWNTIYERRGPERQAPSRFLTSVVDLLPPHARVLDVAGGAGRNALFLAERGASLTVLDIAERGLERAADAARAAGLRVDVEVRDIDERGLPPGSWDAVLIVDFLLRPLFASLARAVVPGGVLAVAHPTERNLRHHAKPSCRYLLHPGELLSCIPGFEPVLYREGWCESGRHEARLVARRETVRH
ncbi:class I SAM-dependent methyltransferase [Haliangium ochraceum]|uniref:Methyltransferase type 12 n=1 Tax=Haliangium ochraceum (strain DSM 14365 / JCM 11303 / SMP-2) TaxID=502025 RepID=D0LRE0_HALO1|nr:class I SAM-dependent methyltransferase [Haliangium ochraceum]ACY17168.1 Methyltransferase type 12 [Haliangium ochraceum DSM 14365]